MLMQKLKSLRNHVLELDWHKPTDDMVARRLMTIAKAEGLTVNDATLRELARAGGGDIRLLLGQLQMIRLRTSALSFQDVKVAVCSLYDLLCMHASMCCSLHVVSRRTGALGHEQGHRG